MRIFMFVFIFSTGLFAQSYPKENIIPLKTGSSLKSSDQEEELFEFKNKMFRAVKNGNCSALLRYLDKENSKIDNQTLDVIKLKELINDLHATYKGKYDMFTLDVNGYSLTNNTNIFPLNIELEYKTERLFFKAITITKIEKD